VAAAEQSAAELRKLTRCDCCDATFLDLDEHLASSRHREVVDHPDFFLEFDQLVRAHGLDGGGGFAPAAAAEAVVEAATAPHTAEPPPRARAVSAVERVASEPPPPVRARARIATEVEGGVERNVDAGCGGGGSSKSPATLCSNDAAAGGLRTASKRVRTPSARRAVADGL
jgi:hypothetical protein